ncbi:MAG: hypothetical protein K6L76_02770 [Agarilytica sp.]
MKKYRVNRRVIFYPLAILFYANFSAEAEPMINAVNGSVNHGSTVTLNGVDFGNKPNAQPVLWDMVENIASYASLTDGDTIPVGGEHPWPSPYGNSSGNNRVKMERSVSEQRGISSASYKAVDQKRAYLDGLRWDHTDALYISWWWKQDRELGEPNHSSKWLRVSDDTDETGKTFSFTQQQAYVYAGDTYCANDWEGFDGNAGNWTFIEAFFDNANKTFTIRIDGEYLFEQVSWDPCTSFQFNEIWKLGFDGGGTSPPEITWWMDDIYVDNTFARVMLGNASTYAESSHFEMQNPISWANNSINIELNSGSFSNNTTAYIYVIDNTGDVNPNGFPVTVSTDIEPANAAPRPPRNIAIESNS